MRVLWVCNIMLPMIAKQLHREASNKEGWLSGLADVVLERQPENGIDLAIAFPAPKDLASPEEGSVCRGRISVKDAQLGWYGFREDVANAHVYEERLEPQMEEILKDFQPDVIHCFGTEYPHTLAMCRAAENKRSLLVGIQGLCKVYAQAYFANLPERVIRCVTLRDFLKRDTIVRQQEKFALRGEREAEAVRLAGNVTGRTAWDRHYTQEWNPNAEYFKMNETLRPNFYTGEWSQESCEPHSIFLSQGDYPIKGLHYMLLALPAICEIYPDTQVYVAGNSVVSDQTLKDRLKIGGYGKYLRELIRDGHLKDRLHFLGKLDAEQMKERYLKSALFVCCSTAENSPNSLGEAMLLGVPCVSADVGGIPSIFEKGRDGILYEGYRDGGEEELLSNAGRLADAVLEMWSDSEKQEQYRNCERSHARATHDREANYLRLMEIYARIAGESAT